MTLSEGLQLVSRFIIYIVKHIHDSFSIYII